VVHYVPWQRYAVQDFVFFGHLSTYLEENSHFAVVKIVSGIETTNLGYFITHFHLAGICICGFFIVLVLLFVCK